LGTRESARKITAARAAADSADDDVVTGSGGPPEKETELTGKGPDG
jgi:hypothetical protein